MLSAATLLTASIAKPGTVDLPPSSSNVDPAVALGAGEKWRIERIVCAGVHPIRDR